MTRALLKFTTILVIIFLTIPFISLIWLLHLEGLRKWSVQQVFRLMAKAIGLHIHLIGNPTAERPALLVSNHCSYIDIFTLGAALPLSFTPKSDIRWWPLVGWCCMLAGCVFIERKPRKLPATRAQIHQKLRMGRMICLFAEGTTNDGNSLKPFKSGFFSLAEGESNLTVQPATIRYTHRNGQPLDPAGRSAIAWYGEDTTLLPHLLRFLSWKSVSVDVVLHPPVHSNDFSSRKALCQHCETVVREALNHPENIA